MPAVVGVITSPTGAVIRDILHRIRDRWPCQVLVWPVVVQGDAAPAQVSAAIRGFNAIQPGGPVPRPDIIIVARGGGSVEDLWAFNDEGLARTVAEGTIPLISAVGHETDTTLIDFVSDRRAPTPTAAAEMATPVLVELRALISDFDRRLNRCGSRTLEERRTRLVSAGRGLPRPADLLALAQQRFDIASGRLDAALHRNTTVHAQDLLKITARLTPDILTRQRTIKGERLADLGQRLHASGSRAPDRTQDRLADLSRRLNACGTRSVDRVEKHARLPLLWTRLESAGQRRLTRSADQLANIDKLRLSLNPERPLELGFALVRKGDGTLARSAADLVSGERVNLKFKSGDRDAVIDGEGGFVPPPAPTPIAAPKPRPKPTPPKIDQGDLF
jgi:exodeoxyribonuclease VII large subunit